MKKISVVLALMSAVCFGNVQQVFEDLKKEGIEKGWTFKVDNTWVLQEGVEKVSGLKFPKDAFLDAPIVDIKPLADLPSKFSWRAQEVTGPAIKNQGSCGSCWAFAATHVFEWALAIFDNAHLDHHWDKADLAEQAVVSCDNTMYGCGGGWFPGDYFKSDGLPFEKEYPYKASNGRCKKFTPAAKAVDWAYLSKDEPPTVDELKTAIKTFGPVWVGVTANNAMASYGGGVFNGCSGGQENHAVVLEGWDDATKTWEMANSWGVKWGDEGYMKIKWGCSRIGRVAAFLIVK